MSIRFMIIDGQADFRSLLMHHISAHWHDAIISEYDPVESGYLPDEFTGAGNDIILLGNELGERDGLEVSRKFLKQPKFPALVYFGNRSEAGPILDRGVALSLHEPREVRKALFPGRGEGFPLPALQRLQPTCALG